MVRRFTALILTAVLIVLDRAAKILAIRYLKPSGSKTIIKGIFNFRYVENTGAAFSFFQGKTIILIALTSVLLLAGLYALLWNKVKPGLLYTGFLLATAGGIGNYIDRITRGYVIDFIEPVFVDFAVFNLADCLITVGAFIIIAYLVYDIYRDFRKAKNEKP